MQCLALEEIQGDRSLDGGKPALISLMVSYFDCT